MRLHLAVHLPLVFLGKTFEANSVRLTKDRFPLLSRYMWCENNKKVEVNRKGCQKVWSFSPTNSGSGALCACSSSVRHLPGRPCMCLLVFDGNLYFGVCSSRAQKTGEGGGGIEDCFVKTVSCPFSCACLSFSQRCCVHSLVPVCLFRNTAKIKTCFFRCRAVCLHTRTV